MIRVSMAEPGVLFMAWFVLFCSLAYFSLVGAAIFLFLRYRFSKPKALAPEAIIQKREEAKKKWLEQEAKSMELFRKLENLPEDIDPQQLEKLFQESKRKQAAADSRIFGIVGPILAALTLIGLFLFLLSTLINYWNTGYSLSILKNGDWKVNNPYLFSIQRVKGDQERVLRTNRGFEYRHGREQRDFEHRTSSYSVTMLYLNLESEGKTILSFETQDHKTDLSGKIDRLYSRKRECGYRVDSKHEGRGELKQSDSHQFGPEGPICQPSP